MLMVGYCKSPRSVITVSSIFFRYNLLFWDCDEANLIKSFLLQLKAVNAEYFFTQNGKWNFNNKVSMCRVYFRFFVCILNGVSIRFGTLSLQGIIRARDIEKWAVNDFSACCHIKNLVQDLVISGGMKGIVSLFSHSVIHDTFAQMHFNPHVWYL